MPDITVTIPVSVVADLTVRAEFVLGQVHVDYSAMTSGQKLRRYIAELLKAELLNKRQQDAQTAVQPTINTALATATTDAGGIV